MDAVFQQLLGNKTDSCSDWNIHGRLLWNTKINGDLNRAVADCLGIYFLDCSIGMMAPLILASAFGAGIMPTRSKTAPSHPVFWVIRTSRVNADLQMAPESHTQILVPTQTLTSIIFPSSTPPSGYHYPYWEAPTPNGLILPSSETMGVWYGSLLRVATLWVWIQPYGNGIFISWHYFFP